MTTTPTASPELLDLDHLEALARAATAGPWLHRRDPGNPIGAQHCVKLAGEQGAWVCDCIDNADRSTIGGIAGERNAGFIAAANPSAVLELIALARRAALANQPAPTVPADAMSQFAAWKGYELPALNGDGHFDKDWLHREWRAFQAGMARAAHQPAQEQAEPDSGIRGPLTDVQRAKCRDMYNNIKNPLSGGYQTADDVIRVIRQAAVYGYANARHDFAAQQEPVVAPQQAEAPGALPGRIISATPGMSIIEVKIDHGFLPEWLDPGYQVRVAPAAPSAPGTPEAPKKPAHGHRDYYYLLANGRRLGLEPIGRMRNMPNWVLAMELFATGSTSAHQICRDAGVDPDSTTIQRAAQLDGGQEGSESNG